MLPRSNQNLLLRITEILVWISINYICLNAVQSQEIDSLIIKTKNGIIRGSTIVAGNGKEVNAWYGIPFAEPPTGDLRFKHPVPADGWEDIKDTTIPPNSCYQALTDFYSSGIILSEDCLYLSVIVPKPRPSKAAVLVWIYGGAFFSGTTTLEMYDYQTLASEQNVIVVAAQYRVGALGFLYMGTEDTPGNAGLFDQALAFSWIQENIGAFGGDREKVTLFGESAGAVSVGMHLVSPVSRDLFSRAIMQSGSPLASHTIVSKEEIVARGLMLAEGVGCPQWTNVTQRDCIDKGFMNLEDSPSFLAELEATVDCLRKAEASAIVENQPFSRMRMIKFPFVPIFDGHFFERHPQEKGEDVKRTLKDSSILMGSNSQEGYMFLLFFLTTFKRNPFQDQEVSPSSKFRNIVQQEIYPMYSNLTILSILHEYSPWNNLEDVNLNLDALDKMVGDQHFTCPLNQFAEQYIQQEDFIHNQIYMYYFTHQSSKNEWPDWMPGAHHTDDIKFVFGEPLTTQHGHSYTESEKLLSSSMMAYWANFARTGNPNVNPDGSQTELHWPQHTKENHEYLRLHTGAPQIGRGPRTKQCAFWNNLFKHLNSLPDTRLECGKKLEMEQEILEEKTSSTEDYLPKESKISSKRSRQSKPDEL